MEYKNMTREQKRVLIKQVLQLTGKMSREMAIRHKNFVTKYPSKKSIGEYAFEMFSKHGLPIEIFEVELKNQLPYLGLYLK